MSSLEEARRGFELSWGALGSALERETGARPRRLGWVLPLVVAAAAYTLGRVLKLQRRGGEDRGRRSGPRR